MSEIGLQQFLLDLDQNLVERTRFGTFGIMCPELMAGYVGSLGMKMVRIRHVESSRGTRSRSLRNRRCPRPAIPSIGRVSKSSESSSES